MKQNIYQEALEKFGIDSQVIMTFEEMAELQKVLCKFLRNNKIITPEILDHVADEIADVEVMLSQMKEHFQCKELVKRKKIFKLNRLAKRLKKYGG